MKSSMFNFSTYLESGDMVIMNTYRGTDSLLIVPHEKCKKVERWLDNRFDIDLDDDFKKMVDKGFFVEENCDEKMLRELSYCKSRMDNNLHLVIYVTKRCNFRCKYCGYSFENAKDMGKDIQEGIVNYIRKNIGKYDSIILDWFGGEPTLNIDAIEYISSRVIKICRTMKKPLFSTITTNGYLLTPQNVKRLLDCNVFKYVITIDGLKITHDKLRVSGDEKPTFDVIIQNLKDMKTKFENTFEVWIRTNITTEIAKKEYLQEYYSYFNNEFGDDPRFSLFARPTNDLGADRTETIRDILLENNDTSMASVFKELSLTVDKIQYKGNARDLNVGGCRCPASRMNKYDILEDGTINKCDDGVSSELSIGYLLPNGIMEIDESIHAKWLFNNAGDKLEKCDDCPLSMVCNMDGCPRNRILTGETQCPLGRDEFAQSMVLLASEKDTEVL